MENKRYILTDDKRILVDEEFKPQDKLKRESSLWRQRSVTNRLACLLGIFFCLVGVIGIKRWLGEVESHLTNIQKQTNRYHDSVVTMNRLKVDPLE